MRAGLLALSCVACAAAAPADGTQATDLWLDDDPGDVSTAGGIWLPGAAVGVAWTPEGGGIAWGGPGPLGHDATRPGVDGWRLTTDPPRDVFGVGDRVCAAGASELSCSGPPGPHLASGVASGGLARRGRRLRAARRRPRAVW